MMFCSKCGNKVENNQNFCSKCGNKILPTPNSGINTYSAQVNDHTPQHKKINTKKIFIGVGIVVSIILAVCIVCSIVSNIIPKRVDFDLKFDRVEIQEFMDIVCENTDVEYAQVGRVSIGGDTFTYGDYMTATVTVKPHGKVEEEIAIRFYHDTDDTDDISSIVVYYHDYDSENEVTCRDAIVEALEISFCGSSKAKEYTDKFSSIGKDLSIYDDVKIITSYSLTSEANVRISCDGSFADDWTGRYCIYKN